MLMNKMLIALTFSTLLAGCDTVRIDPALLEKANSVAKGLCQSHKGIRNYSLRESIENNVYLPYGFDVVCVDGTMVYKVIVWEKVTND